MAGFYRIRYYSKSHKLENWQNGIRIFLHLFFIDRAYLCARFLGKIFKLRMCKKTQL